MEKIARADILGEGGWVALILTQCDEKEKVARHHTRFAVKMLQPHKITCWVFTTQPTSSSVPETANTARQHEARSLMPYSVPSY